MKKGYIKLGIIVFAVLGTYTLLACNSSGNAVSAPEDMPVDLEAAPIHKASEHGEISTADFDKMIKGDKLTMVDFYTTWCGPCKMMAPDVQRLKADKSDLVNVLQVNAEAQLEVAQRYNINSYPTIMFFKKGQVINTLIGLRKYDELLAEINRLK